MRYLILSDIHANLEALDAVLVAAPPWDRVLVLGDLVGYGAEPNEVVQRVRDLEPYAIARGNHDKVAAGLDGADDFNPTAKRAARWTHDALKEENRAYLRALAAGPIVVDDLVEICHGSPVNEDTYIFGEGDIEAGLAHARRPVCFFGHTHFPMAVALTAEGELDVLLQGGGDHQPLVVVPEGRLLVNPGSVGQPRDGDPRAAYAILDTATLRITLARVEYRVQDAHDRILAAGLPRMLAQRLLLGR